MSREKVLIGGEWCDSVNPSGSFTAVDPATGVPCDRVYPVSGHEDVERACGAAADAVVALRAIEPARIAQFLDDYAARIDADRDTLVAIAARETALPASPRLANVELPRATNQLRQAAAAARDRSWCHATIDTGVNIRAKYGAMGGAVVVFGPNNFPFAFNSIAGGDFAAAMAAGNPVIAKANTGHPETTQRFAELAFDAIVSAGLPRALVQLIYRTPPDVGFRLVTHPQVAATGFTGSRHAGLQLKAAADKAGKPIYLEMSSANPVFVLPGALAERGAAIAKELFDSCALGAGQFCTRPGITVVRESPHAEVFVAEAAAHFGRATAGTLLGAKGPSTIAAAITVLTAHGAVVLTGGHVIDRPGYAYANTLLRVSGDAFLASPEALQTEAFGTVNLVIVAANDAQVIAVAAALEGNLTGTIYSETTGRDEALYERLEPVLRTKVGRLLNDKMPTGVAVTPAMNHGGPYPATGHPGFTAVGIPASMLRFAALHSYDNVRPHRLPPELADKNPTGRMWRLVDGAWTQGDVAR
jgi:NADP-dependent aldehyde dehydrogenase